ncbi:histidinol-phosphate transaminase [Arenibacter sp. GZD96]|uniref:pyridoxal phosphate-dependent aminotransferase n=1 Tax=Aurantibrevibacter litoralis TaxID=3106030 RepID=UPI002B003E38|nr:histidinol-phosphate transaminase [Arenibacter sp. GZD-96]MEA1787458.1 histidinol-phosphate transaminase [Arenibacter sp. GZD-96]
MNTIDRRNWLKTIGLSGSFALLGGLEAMAFHTPEKSNPLNNLVRLSSNENPFGPSKKVRDVILNSFDDACRYPHGYLSSLTEMIAIKEGVSQDHIVITGGSTEGLRATGLTYALSGGEVIAADPTFQAMLTYTETFGGYVHRVPLNAKMEHDLEAMAHRINNRTRLIFICNPNNPTGTLLEPNKLKDFCVSHHHQALLFSDEAYYDYITEPDYPSMVSLVKEGRNIIVSKTFSKIFGLAGMRIGYLIARPDIADRLKKSVMANTNVLGIAAAKAALHDTDFYKFSILKNTEAKTAIYQTLDHLGLEYIPSHTNFVFFKTGKPITELVEKMRKENVLIGRPFPPLTDWARVSTGRLPEVQRFADALKKVLG